MNVWFGFHSRVQTDVAQTVHDDAIDEVDGLPGAGEVHLGPVVLAGGAVDVAGGRGGLYSGVPEIRGQNEAAEDSRGRTMTWKGWKVYSDRNTDRNWHHINIGDHSQVRTKTSFTFCIERPQQDSQWKSHSSQLVHMIGISQPPH